MEKFRVEVSRKLGACASCMRIAFGGCASAAMALVAAPVIAAPSVITLPLLVAASLFAAASVAHAIAWSVRRIGRWRPDADSGCGCAGKSVSAQDSREGRFISRRRALRRLGMVATGLAAAALPLQASASSDQTGDSDALAVVRASRQFAILRPRLAGGCGEFSYSFPTDRFAARGASATPTASQQTKEDRADGCLHSISSQRLPQKRRDLGVVALPRAVLWVQGGQVASSLMITPDVHAETIAFSTFGDSQPPRTHTVPVRADSTLGREMASARRALHAREQTPGDADRVVANCLWVPCCVEPVIQCSQSIACLAGCSSFCAGTCCNGSFIPAMVATRASIAARPTAKVAP